MSLFGPRIRNTDAAGPTVSTAATGPQLDFWQRNRKAITLFGCCAALLLIAHFLSGRSREDKREAKAKKAVALVAHDETDKGDAIAQMQANLAEERKQQEAKAQQSLAESILAGQLTPEQRAALNNTNAGGVVASPAAAVQPRAPYYDPSGSGAAHVPDKPATLVISYRSDSTSSPAPAPSGPVMPALPQFLMSPPALPATAAVPPSESAEAHGGHMDINKKIVNPEDAAHQLASFTGEKYRIREGTWIPCTEELRINGSFASDINCLVSIPIYSASGSRLLMKQGTLALGHVAAVGSQNQQRLFVVFDTFIMPDGFTVNYENAAGLDQIGQAGLRDQVNHHYIQMFGASVAIAAVGGLAQIGNYGASNITAGSQYRSGLTQGMSESSMQILNRFATVLPTFIIREGARNNIHLPFSLWLPDYSHHTMKGDL